MPNNTPQETAWLLQAIESIAASTYLDHRVILAVVLQESHGCVRNPTTNGGVQNPGLMQDYDGTHSCNTGGTQGGGTVQNPCPQSEIVGMITDGAAGTQGPGTGFADNVNSAGSVDVSAFYKAARIYNSGSIDPSGDLGAGGATHCYSSDIANWLTGWVQAPS